MYLSLKKDIKTSQYFMLYNINVQNMLYLFENTL